MILVKVTGLSLSNMGFVVLLKGEHDPRTLPIFIGGAEAQSIAIRMDNVEIPRPLTMIYSRVCLIVWSAD
jgi:bifunctional DNase/RNase